MTMTRVLLSECPVRLYARKNYTLTLAEDCKSGVIKPSSEFTIEGVDSAKITFDGNSVTSTASFISLDEMTNATFKNVKFTWMPLNLAVFLSLGKMELMLQPVKKDLIA